MGVCNCSMFCCALLCALSSIAIILMGKRELIALLNLSSWCLVVVEWLFLAVPRGCLQFVIVVFPDHTHLLFLVLEVKGLKQGYIFKNRPLYISSVLFNTFPSRSEYTKKKCFPKKKIVSYLPTLFFRV